MIRLSMRLTSLVVAAGLMAGCGVINRGKKVTPTVGERISVLTSETDIENGRTRRYYKLTEKGSKTLQKSTLEWQRMSGAISGILGGAV